MTVGNMLPLIQNTTFDDGLERHARIRIVALLETLHGRWNMANNRDDDDKRSGSSSNASRNQAQGGGSDNRSGGQSDNRSSSAENNPGNFKNDPERASEAGRKGGEASHDSDSRGRGSDQGRGGSGSSGGDKR
jgi:general stress protein YciG